MNSLNPQDRTCVQMLLDMASSPHLPPEKRAQLTELVQYLNGVGQSVARETDDRFAAHMYPDRALTWGRLYGYDVTSSLDQLTTSAKSLLWLYIRLAGQGGLVAVKKADAMRVTGIGRKNNYLAAVKELILSGCIVEYAPSYGQTPTVYMINPQICTVGKDAPNVQLNRFLAAGGQKLKPSGDMMVTQVKGVKNGQEFYYRTLVDKPPGTKKAAPAPLRKNRQPDPPESEIADNDQLPDDMKNLFTEQYSMKDTEEPADSVTGRKR